MPLSLERYYTSYVWVRLSMTCVSFVHVGGSLFVLIQETDDGTLEPAPVRSECTCRIRFCGRVVVYIYSCDVLHVREPVIGKTWVPPVGTCVVSVKSVGEGDAAVALM